MILKIKNTIEIRKKQNKKIYNGNVNLKIIHIIIVYIKFVNIGVENSF